MKKLTLNFLIVFSLSLWIGGEVSIRNQILSDIDLKAYNTLFQKVLNKPEQKLALHHTYSRYLINHLFFQSEEAQKQEEQLAYMVEFYIAYDKYIQREEPKITTSPTWKALIVNFYLLSPEEKKKLFEYLIALDIRPPVKLIY